MRDLELQVLPTRCAAGKQLIRALAVAFDYIDEMEKGVQSAADAKKRYHGLVGARRR